MTSEYQRKLFEALRETPELQDYEDAKACLLMRESNSSESWAWYMGKNTPYTKQNGEAFRQAFWDAHRDDPEVILTVIKDTLRNARLRAFGRAVERGIPIPATIGDTGRGATETAILALTESILALVEEQRIANQQRACEVRSWSSNDTCRSGDAI